MRRRATNSSRQRPCRLRDDAGPDAALRRSTATVNVSATSASAATIETERAYATENTNGTFRTIQERARSAAGSSRTRGCRSRGATRTSTSRRSADHPRERRVHHAAARSSPAAASAQTSTLGSPTSTTCAAITPCASGIELDGGWYHSDDTTNYLGTYTFESLEAFEAGTPRSYTRRIGDPNIDYNNLQGGIYIQDDIRSAGT